MNNQLTIAPRSSMLGWLATVAACILALVYVATALLKAQSVSSMQATLSTVTFIPHWLRSILPHTLIVIELVVAYLILMSATRTVGLLVSAAMLVVFTAFVAWLVSDPYAPPCNCMGELRLAADAHTANKLALARNGVLIVLNGVALAPSLRRIVGYLRRHPARTGHCRASGEPTERGVSRATPAGFTLLELLVVIGIIGLLLAILLPVLSRSRGAAREVTCAAQQREILNAALGAAAETRYLPLTGVVHIPANLTGYGSLPPVLGDSGRRKYVYAREASGEQPAFSPVEEQVVPPPYALLDRLGGEVGGGDISGYSLWHENVSRHETLRIFTCPEMSDSLDRAGERMMLWDTGGDGWGGLWLTQSDYAFNSGAMGFHHESRFRPSRRRGHLVDLTSPSRTLLFADAATHAWNGGPVAGFEPQLSEVAERVTLRDVLEGNEKVTTSTPLDADRHRGKANVAYADGHVAAIALQPAALEAAVLSPSER